MSGSMDDHQVKVVNATQECLLTVLVYPDGRTMFVSNQPKEWVAKILRQLADTQDPAGDQPPQPPAPTMAVEMVNALSEAGIEGMVSDLRQRETDLSTEEIMMIIGKRRNLSDADHRLLLTSMVALLLQRVACG